MTASLRRVRPPIVLLTCCTALFISSMNAALINVALPSIRADLGASAAQLQWLVDAYTLVLGTLLLASGSLADRFGRKKAFILGLGLFAVTSSFCALAPSVLWLIVGRGLQAVGGVLLTPVALSIISATYTDPAQRARAIGVWGAVIGISLGSGPLLGGFLTESFGWEATFWMNVPVCTAALVATVVFVPESRAARPRRLDPAGQLLIMAFLGGTVGALIEGPERGWDSPLVLGLMVLAMLGLIAFIAVERRVTDPVVDIRFFGSAPFSAAVIIAVAVSTAQGNFLFLFSLLLQGPFGYTPLGTGALLLPLAVALAVSSPLAGRLIANRGTRPALVTGGACVAASSLLLIFLRTDASTWYFVVVLMIAGAGLGFINPPISTTAVEGLPPSQSGAASGIAGASRQVGVALGVALAGSVARADNMSLLQASHGMFALVTGLGVGIVLLGIVSTSAWAHETRRRLADLFNE